MFTRPRRSVDETDFRTLFQTHAGFVWRTLRRFGVAPAELDDVCQEVFLVVHRRLPEFEGRSQLRTWIYEIARRSALAQRRTEAARAQVPLDDRPEPVDSARGPSEQAAHGQALRWLESTLVALDADKREAFVLYELEDLTLAEVAAALAAPINTVHYRIQAAWAFIDARAERSYGSAAGTRQTLSRRSGDAR